MDNWQTKETNPVQRARIWYALILIIFGIFAVRLFYLQIIRYDHYKAMALSDQVREYDVMPERGTISANLNGKTVPLVLNQKLYTVFADPSIIKNPDQTAGDIASLLGLDKSKLATQLRTQNTRYVVLGKRISADVKDKILAFKDPGIATQQVDYRVYPQGAIASQVLGFVNDDGQGEYGVEQALDSSLAGQKGRLKAITDVNGVPLAASSDNLLIQPKAGSNVDLTLNIGMQMQLEQIIKAAADKDHSKGVSAVIMDVHTGAIKAMANYPTYDPANYQTVADASLFQNNAVTESIETGSIMKVLTTSTALNIGAITPTATFYDPGTWTIDGATISDVAEDHSTGTQSIYSILNLSLNTGATWMLMQMGGGQINDTARTTLYDYFSNHFMLGRRTGIEQGYESPGILTPPGHDGNAIDLTYAEMSFGQAITATALQMDAAFSSVLNGGTYYKPYLVQSIHTATGDASVKQPIVLKHNVVSPAVSSAVISLLEQVNQGHVDEGFRYLDVGPHYSIGGKTGSAQIALPTGGYSATQFNATYLGFVGGDTPQYAVAVYNYEPQISYGFAGAQAAQPIFGTIAHMLINNYGVTPKTK